MGKVGLQYETINFGISNRDFQTRASQLAALISNYE